MTKKVNFPTDTTYCPIEHSAFDRQVIQVIEPDGRRLGEIKFPSCRLTSLKWSPDSQEILFDEADAAGDMEIFLIDDHCSNLRNIASHEGIDYFPDWLTAGE